MASLGAKVLQTRSVEIAMLHRVPVRVLSTFAPDAGGTLVCDEEDIVEKKPVTGIAYSRDEAKITLHKIPDRPGIAAAIFGPLADSGINIDMIVQNVSEDGRKTDLTFTVSRGDLAVSLATIEKAGAAIGYRDLTSDANVAKVSIIGIGMRAPSGRRPDHVPHAVRQGHQHPGDLDVGDQSERAHLGGVCGAGGESAAFGLRIGCRMNAYFSSPPVLTGGSRAAARGG